jgi:hypothetical protein
MNLNILNHSAEICKQSKAGSFKTPKGVSALPLYSYKKPCDGTRKGKMVLAYRRKTQEFVIRWKGRKNIRLSATFKVQARTSSP